MTPTRVVADHDKQGCVKVGQPRANVVVNLVNRGSRGFALRHDTVDRQGETRISKRCS